MMHMKGNMAHMKGNMAFTKGNMGLRHVRNGWKKHCICTIKRILFTDHVDNSDNLTRCDALYVDQDT